MIKVLIVEDEDIIRKGLIYTYDWLELDCIVVGEATNGQEAIEMIDSLEPDIVITDIKMPIVNGIEILQHYPERTFEVIFVTGHADFEYAKSAIEHQVNHYILKPIDKQELIRVMKETIELHKHKEKLQLIENKIKEMDDFNLIDIEFYCNNSSYRHSQTLQAIQYIMEHYFEKITNVSMSDELQISRTQLTKFFKEDTNHTLNDFINKYRIQMALKLMLKSDFRIYEIAEKVGYSEYKYFSQVFKNYMAYTPTDFLQLKMITKKSE